MCARKSDARKGLEKQLSGLIKGLDDTGVAFLIEQANVLHYNMQVEVTNRELVKLKKGPGDKKASKTKRSPVQINIIADEDKKNYILQIDLVRKFITREELRHIVTICQNSDAKSTIIDRLFGWLNKERRDILLDGKMSGKKDSTLGLIVDYIRKHYKIKK